MPYSRCVSHIQVIEIRENYLDTDNQRQLDTTFFLVLKFVVDSNVKAITSMAVPLRDSFLRDTLTRAVDNDMESFQVVIENINRYVEIVHHSYYSTDLLQCMSNLGIVE